MDTYEDAAFVKIAKEGSEDFMELPKEKDGTILLSTIQAQFPTCIGLKYKSSSGGWRGIRCADNVLDTPFGGWGETIYYITESETLKRKSSATSDGASAVKSRKSASGLLEDLIVFGLPFGATDDDLKEYFTKECGELAFHEVKYDRETKRSRGFGFIRFTTEEDAKKAMDREHEMMGRKLEIRMSKKKDNPLRLFVGRLPGGTTQEGLKEFFSEFGELSDIFLPSPFRGFGFVTFSSQEDGKRAVRMSHEYKGRRLNVVVAEAKDERPPRGEQQQSFKNGPSNYTWSGGENNRSSSYGQDRDRGQDRFDPRSSQRGGNEGRYDSQNKRSSGGNDDGYKQRGGNEDRYDSQNRRGGNADRYDPRSSERAGNEDRLYDSLYKPRGGTEDKFDSQIKQRGGNEERFDPQNKQGAGGNDMGADLKSMLLAFLSSQK